MTSPLAVAPLAQHMGQLHAYENFIVIGIAFGPFLVLGVVVFLIRRRDLSEEDVAAEGTPSDGDVTARDAGVSPGRPPAT